MSAGRLKGISLLAVAALGAALLLAWSQTWFEIEVSGVAHPVGGDVAAGAIAALGLAALALVAALALAGPVFRVVLAVLAALLGATAIVAACFVLAEPILAVAPLVTELTGVSGVESVAGLVEAVRATAWPAVAIVAGALLAVAGVAILLTSSRWPAGGRRYARTRAVAEQGPHDAVDDWDALSEGEDPTDDRPAAR